MAGKAREIMDCLVAKNPHELTKLVNGGDPREPGGIPREKVVSVESDPTHGRWVVFYYRMETKAEVNLREDRAKKAEKAKE